MQYFRTSMTLPFLFEIGQMEIVKRTAAPRNSMDSWKMQSIDAKIAQSSEVPESKNLAESLRSFDQLVSQLRARIKRKR